MELGQNPGFQPGIQDAGDQPLQSAGASDRAEDQVRIRGVILQETDGKIEIGVVPDHELDLVFLRKESQIAGQHLIGHP